ncbi:hypothetical protein [Microbacterium trichothecenolyticum]|uniref:Uncharacterized protein n=1 Tax=Microbacterium trichothecenolyticum TaxID=69370 RepID=A0ABU0TTJ2_MICTR|nr:hypothetical protein [Microbacterium trichothecenolyticum]MDQ1122981.1 hypothetical protein [Microbacterium trichothecenolyticum]
MPTPAARGDDRAAAYLRDRQVEGVPRSRQLQLGIRARPGVLEPGLTVCTSVRDGIPPGVDAHRLALTEQVGVQGGHPEDLGELPARDDVVEQGVQAHPAAEAPRDVVGDREGTRQARDAELGGVVRGIHQRGAVDGPRPPETVRASDQRPDHGEIS